MPGIIYHVNDISVYLGRQTGGGVIDVLQFQWQKNATDIHDHGSRYHGTDSDTLHILMVERGDKGCYRCCVKNYEGEEFSNDAVLTVSKFVLTSYTCQPLEFRSVIQNHFTMV